MINKMKRYTYFLLSPLLLLLWGCPIELNYPIDEPGSRKIDRDLLGVWSCEDNNCTEFRTLEVSEGNAPNSYLIKVLEKGESYMSDDSVFVGYSTEFANELMMYLRPIEGNKWMHYRIEKSNGTITLRDVVLADQGIDAVTSTAALREEVKRSSELADYTGVEKVILKKR